MNDLVVLETINLPLAFSEGRIDPILEEIERQARSFVADISTIQGRKDIASLAHKIAKSKTALDAAGKELVSGWKEQAKKVDAERGRVWDRLEGLQKEIRAPLTEWENADKERIAAHEAALAEIVQLAALPDDAAPAEIERRIARSVEISGSRSWEEFTAKAKIAHDQTYEILLKKLEARRKWDAEQAELVRLRQEEAERKQREHEERLKAEAAAKAKAEAEEAARLAAVAEAVRVKAEQEKAELERQRIEREKAEAEERARKAEEEKEALAAQAERARLAAEEARKAAEAKAEQDRIDAAAKLEIERLAAEGRANLAAIQAKRDAEAAAQREREKIEAEKRREAEETAKREADKKHRAKIHNEALVALLSTGVSEDDCKKIITVIAKGEIPHIKISY